MTDSPDLCRACDSGPAAAGAEKGLLLLALFALLGQTWKHCARRHRARRAATAQRQPRKLQRWEGEGGRPDPEPEPEAQP